MSKDKVLSASAVGLSLGLPAAVPPARAKEPGTVAACPDRVTLSPSADAAPKGKPQYVPGQVLVKFTKDLSRTDVSDFADKNGLSVLRNYDVPDNIRESFGGSLYLCGCGPDEGVAKTIARLSGQAGVCYAEPNYKFRLNDPPSNQTADPTPTAGIGPRAPRENIPNDLDARLWGLHNSGQEGGKPGVDIGATRAWVHTTGSSDGPLIAVLDSGIDYNHSDLSDNIWTNPNEIPHNGKDDDHNGYIDDIHGANILAHTGDPMDDNSHGTHVAGTVGAVGNNGIGVVGVNWKATMAAVKFINEKGEGTFADAVGAVFYATRIGARITVNSWGDTGYSKALEDAFRASPALHVAAAGNDSNDNDAKPTYPASFHLPNMIAVAAHDHKDRLADFSNFGGHSVHLAAPGVDIYSTKPIDAYEFKSGTSMAAPHVAGVAALILSQNSALSNAAVKARLINTVTKGDAYRDKTISGGRLNADGATKDDTTPPATPNDLKLVSASATRMRFQWTETGDDGMSGNAAQYEIRFSTRPITSETWNTAATVALGRNPKPPGSLEDVTVAIPPFPSARNYFFALKVSDQLGNESDVATVPGTSLAATTAFEDDFETDRGNWAATGSWARVQIPGRGWVYTDSPNGPYANNSDTWIVSKPISLAKVSNPSLLFDEKHDTEKFYDFGRVELSNDDGQSWQEMARYDGTGDWTTRLINLSDFQGQTVRLRFRMTSDASMQKDGFYVDNVRIAGDAPK